MSLYTPKDFRRLIGGVNYISGETNLRPYDLADASNVTYDINGSIAQREGLGHFAGGRYYDRDLLSYWKFNEASNVTRRDSAGGRFHLIDVNSNLTATPHQTVLNVFPLEHLAWDDNAARFQSANLTELRSATLDSTSPLDGRGDFSVSFWYHPDPAATPSSNQFFLHSVNDPDGSTPTKPLSGPSWKVFGKHSAGDLYVQFSVYTGGAWVTLDGTSLGTVTSNSWHHVVCVKRDSTDDVTADGLLTIYRDGVRLDSSAIATQMPYFHVALPVANLQFAVGAQITNGVSGSHLNGYMDELQYWRRALDNDEVTDLYNLNIQGGSEAVAVAGNTNSKVWKALVHYQPRFGSDEVMGICAGQVMKYEDNIADRTFVPIPMPWNIPGYLNPNVRSDTAQLFDRLYMGNGIDANLRYEGGSSLFTAGVRPTGFQAAVGTTVTAASGVPFGEIEPGPDAGFSYFYYYRFIPLRIVGGGRIVSGAPSDPFPALGVEFGFGATLNSISFTMPDYGIPIDMGFTHWGVYRAQIRDTAAAPPPADEQALSAFDWLEDVPYDPGATYVDLMSQATANAQLETLDQYLNLTHAPPCQILETTSLNGTDQLLYTGNPSAPNSLYISDLVTGPDLYVTDEEQYVGRDSNDVITGIAKFFDNLIIFKNDRFFLARPQFDTAGLNTTPYSLVGGNFPWSVVLSNNDVGCESNWSIQNVQNVVLWKDERGIYSIEGVDAFGNVQVKKLSNKIANKLQEIPGERRGDFISVHLRTPRRREYRFAYSTLALNDKFMAYDYDHVSPDPLTGEPVGAFLPWNGIVAEAMAIVEDSITGLDQVYVGDNTGNVFIMDAVEGADENIAGTAIPINSFFKTNFVDMDAAHMTKRWRMIVVEGISTGAALNLSWATDFGIGSGGSFPISMQLGVGSTSLFDVANWDEAFFDGGLNTVAARKRLYNATGHHLQLTFGQTGDPVNINATWKVHGFVLFSVMVPSIRVRKG